MRIYICMIHIFPFIVIILSHLSQYRGNPRFYVGFRVGQPLGQPCDNLSSCLIFSLIAPLLSVTLVSHRNTGLTGFEAKSGPIYGLQKHLK